MDTVTIIMIAQLLVISFGFWMFWRWKEVIIYRVMVAFFAKNEKEMVAIGKKIIEQFIEKQQKGPPGAAKRLGDGGLEGLIMQFAGPAIEAWVKKNLSGAGGQGTLWG